MPPPEKAGSDYILSKTLYFFKKGCYNSDVMHHCIKNRLFGFTLAEVLITLGIIGVVAALTMPSLIAEHQKKQTVARVKKVFSILGQAYQFSQNENGFSDELIDTSEAPNTQAVKDYVDKYWLPYLQVIKTCSNKGDCSYSQGATGPDGSKIAMEGNNRYSVILSDGTMVTFVPFNWSDDSGYYWGGTQKIYIDINGAQKPNILGRDVFMFEINSQKHVLRGLGQDFNEDKIDKNCSKTGNAQYCAAKLIKDGWEIKDDYPW